MSQKFQLRHLSQLAAKEGFCLLHTGVGKGKSFIGHQPVRKMDAIPSGEGHFMGYLAYPNPNLENTIPSFRFYEYERLWDLPSLGLWQTGLRDGLGSEGWKTVISTRVRRSPEQPALSLSKGSRGGGGGRSGEIYSNRSGFRTSGRLEQSVTKSQYIQKIKEIKKLLIDGEIYQMCYAIRFRKKFEGDPFALFVRMTEAQPTAFSAFLNAGDFQILSASPERLFQVKNNIIVTQPIKGTAPLNQKEAFEKGSEKDWAELDMITDLERNDIGRICEYGTLKVTKKRALFQMKNLWHAYSEIRGKLPPDITIKQIFEAMFPGGSVTGCPKKRAIEYIEKLEGHPRNIFTGSIGYVSNRGAIVGQSWGDGGRGKSTKASQQPHNSPTTEMDFNIAIRTALIRDGYIEYWAGSAIVVDSDPVAEYEECLLKAERFLNIL